jgi:hypothetical protein
MRRGRNIVTTGFAIVLTVANGEIVRFQMLEDSFAVSQAARGWLGLFWREQEFDKIMPALA